MRLIEQQMLDAIEQKRNFQAGNTQVKAVNLSCGGTRSEIYLHGNHIANIWSSASGHSSLYVNRETLASWPTPTTKSRLRALGANVYTKNHTTYLDEVAV